MFCLPPFRKTSTRPTVGCSPVRIITRSSSKFHLISPYTLYTGCMIYRGGFRYVHVFGGGHVCKSGFGALLLFSDRIRVRGWDSWLLKIDMCRDRLCNYTRVIMPDEAQGFLVFHYPHALGLSVQRGRRSSLPTKFSQVELRDLLRHRDRTVAVTKS